MAITALVHVFHHGKAKGLAQALLLQLAHLASPDDWTCCPPDGHLAGRLGVDTNTVRRLTRQLIEHGDIIVEPGAMPAGARRYRIPKPGEAVPQERRST